MPAQEYQHEIGQQGIALLGNLIPPQARVEIHTNCIKAKLRIF
jgi:hypothetical protein